MRSLRQYLRQLAIAWIVIQAFSLSALAGFDCCAAHVAPKAETRTTQTAEAAPCPMHAAARSNARPGSNQQNPAKCVLRGTCSGPIAALLAVLSNNGIPAESIATTPVLAAIGVPRPSPETFVVHVESPDTPPPRA